VRIEQFEDQNSDGETSWGGQSFRDWPDLA